MSSALLLQGIAVGALAAFPLGPVGMLCVHRTLTHGARAGVAAASGIALASALWCLAAVQGLGLLAKYLPLSSVGVRVVLGLLLVALAFRNLFRPPTAPTRTFRKRELAGQFFMTLLIVVTNPLTLVTVVALLTAFGVVQPGMSFAAAGELAVGVFAGGLILWLVLSRTLILLRDKLGEHASARFNRIISFCTLTLGVVYISSVFWTR